MNNSKDNFFNENTFTYQQDAQGNPDNEEMQEVIDYVTKQIALFKKVPLDNTLFSAADEIRKYKDLLDNGAITIEEYEIKKKQLLKE